YRGGVKETAFSGVFATVEALRSRAAEVAVHDPMVSDAALEGFGWVAYHLGQPVDLAVIQADHREYVSLTPAHLPGARLLADVRNITDPAAWVGVPRFAVGAVTGAVA